ncbi:MAG: pilus assembly PilX N-terminal domain-containing protein [Candidatus Moranbacteria bacterium]|nr:pilus assembly PilX N-terminal domain-containing protein [Candidatus Moranbacteria bacterium]
MILFYKNKKGSALAFALVIMTVVSIILVSILQFVSSQIRRSSYEIRKQQAFQIAEAGVNDYIWYITKKIGNTTDANFIEDFWAGTGPFTERPRGVGTSYVAGFPANDPVGEYSIEVTPPEPYTYSFMIKSTGRMNSDAGVKKTIQIKIKKEEWSKHVFAVDAIFNVGATTVFTGKVHSNKGINFEGMATDEVSSTVPCINSDTDYGVNHSGDPNPPHPCPTEPPSNFFPSHPSAFHAGRYIRSGIDFASMINNLETMKDKSSDGTHGRYFPNYIGTGTTATVSGRKIILKGNSFDVCTVSAVNSSGIITRYILDTLSTSTSCSGPAYVKNYEIPQNGIIFVNGNVWIEGVLTNKKVTVVAADASVDAHGNSNLALTTGGKNVYLSKNITYTYSNGTEMLGIIGQYNVFVTDDSSNPLNVNAVLIAKNGRVGLFDHFDTTRTSLNITGSIISKEAPFFYTTDGHTWYGFHPTRNYNYDTNLANEAPPFFPTKTGYIIDNWEEF